MSAIRLGLGVAALAVTASWFTAPLREPVDRAPDFALVDQAGRSTSLAALRGRPFALFFGYTHCADACLLTLARLSAQARRDRRDAATRIVMITVDPERDSPAALVRYAARFEPRPTFLTGDAARLADAYTGYRVFRRRVASARGANGYEVEHGTSLCFVDAASRLRRLADSSDDGAQLAADFATVRR